jgi:hypothetical protein
VRVKGEEEDKALANATSCAENTYEMVILAIGLADGTTCVRRWHAPLLEWTH